jgi:hypothetical protein
MITIARPHKNGKAGVPVWAGGTVQGQVIGEGGQAVFFRPVTWGRHFFRLDSGWSVSGPILAQLDKLAVTLLRYVDDTNGIWEVRLEEFKQRAIRRDFGEVQFILPREAWAHTPPPQQPEQLALAI